MCGISGVVKKQAPIQKECLERMAEALLPRGPDMQGFWFSDGFREEIWAVGPDCDFSSREHGNPDLHLHQKPRLAGRIAGGSDRRPDPSRSL